MAILRQIQDARILIVDDQTAEVRLLEQLLRDVGCATIHSTADPREILKLDALHHFDLVLVNLELAKPDGAQAIEQLKALNYGRYVPVVALTNAAIPVSRWLALSAGIRDVVRRPFSRQEFMDHIRSELEVLSLHSQMRLPASSASEGALRHAPGAPGLAAEVIQKLEWATTYRDNQTGLHNLRTSRFSALIGQAAGLGAEQSDNLLNASLMHDIGKIGIPDHILRKPGALDADEWAIMKTHPLIGAEILSDPRSDVMQTARLVALTHHEKWDGSGYPAGLKGEEIPFAGRVVALCDVFDSLTAGHRPYKPAWTIDAAAAYIGQNSGRHFDPGLVGVFQAVLPKMADLQERYAEPTGKSAP